MFSVCGFIAVNKCMLYFPIVYADFDTSTLFFDKNKNAFLLWLSFVASN